MKKLLLSLTCLLFSLSGWGSEASSWPMEGYSADLHDKPSLQSGAQLYMNYCLGCHSQQYQRYERTADDLGIPHEIALENLVFTGQRIGELMKIAMQGETAKNWFGVPPPDLTMVARVRGTEWLYNYLKTFYVDESRPFGVNNKVFENVAMPHALLELQGTQREVCTDHECKLVLDEGSGSMTPDEYDKAVYDLVNYLYYTGEPSRLERHRLGIFVLLFLVILGAFTYLLNREYWKDVH